MAVMKYIPSILMILCLVSCKKFLNGKPDKSLVIPSTLADLQALLDDNPVMNNYGRGLAEASADNYYLTTAIWSSLSSDGQKESYIWGNELFYEQWPNEWSFYYRTVYNANTVLENISAIQPTASNQAQWDNVKGSALFFRAFIFHNVAIIWAKAYDRVTASVDLGIPLKTSSDFNKATKRSSLAETYEQIISDASQSIQLLPETPIHVLRPSKPAAYALLSRVYMSMRNYKLAAVYADSCLQLTDDLMDYKTLSANTSNPFPQFNKEVLFSCAGTYSPLSSSKAKIDSVLIDSYAPGDLRKTFFFKSNNDGTHGFKGNYSGTSSLFYGLAVDEMYLTKAECLARSGAATSAMDLLNELLAKRSAAGFTPLDANDPQTALNNVLTERRKELVMRGIRWMDIKRLNKEGAGITLKRILGNEIYTLPPNDNRYALPIPAYVIGISGIQQNPR